MSVKVTRWEIPLVRSMMVYFCVTRSVNYDSSVLSTMMKYILAVWNFSDVG